MDSEVVLSEKSPQKSASAISKLFFAWLIGIIKKGNREELNSLNDLYVVDNCDKSNVLGDQLEVSWKAETKKAKEKNRKPKLIKALLRMFWKKYFLYGFYMFLHMGFLRVFQPIVISLLIQLFNDDSQGDLLHLMTYGSSLILLTLLIVFINNHSSLQLLRIGMQVRIACGSLVYRKMLKLSNATLNTTVSGKIGNILSNDMNRFDNIAMCLHVIWIVPIKIAFIGYFMWDEIGISFLGGLFGMIFMTVVLQGLSGKLSSHFRKKTVSRTESRLNALNEFLSGIQTIKLSAWETPFTDNLKLLRERELKFLNFTSYLTAFYETLCLVVEKIASYFTLTCYYLLGYAVTADKVFFLSQCHNVLQMSMGVFFPYAIQNGAECKVSLRKVEEVLVLDENKTNDNDDDDDDVRDVVFKDVSVNANGFILTSINIDIKPGELVAIIGPIGSGKTTLVNLLLAELTPDSGSVRTPSKRISYAAQKPWLFNSSIRDNVVFNRKFDRTRYHRTLNATALSKDLESQPYGDRTRVGERGMFLSGGQKSRVNLARAAFSDAEVYVFDDPFSALDPQSAKAVFERCVVKLLRAKTRIVVTHNLEILKGFDKVIIVDSGKIEFQGTYPELLRSGNEFVTSSLKVAKKRLSMQESETSISFRKASLISRMSSMSLWSNVSENQDINNEKLTKETTLRQGFLPYKEYLKAAGGFIPVFFLSILMIIGQISSSYNDYFLTYWTNSDEFSSFTGNYYVLYIYTSALSACILILTIRSFVFFKLCIQASRNLHNRTVDSLARTSMKFFDETPIGRITNRFSKDLATIDCTLPRCAIEAVQILLVTLGVMVMICLCDYYLIIAVIFITVLFAKLPAWYLKTSKRIKHLEGIAKSPVLSHLGTTLDGITTIRAFNGEEGLKSQFDYHQDIHTSAIYLSATCAAAFNLWLDLLAVIFLTLVIYGFIALSQMFEINGSYVGLAVTQAMILTRVLQHGVRQMTDGVNQVTSVERIIEYKNLPKEESHDEKFSESFDKSWPKTPQIQFSNVYLKYSEYDVDILRSLNFRINPGEKVGIVGRSGAGKSSVISAIFRTALIEGSIKIDNFDTREIPLKILRDKVSIIPQDPALFSATIRFNLDPYEHYADSDIWNALEEVDLKTSIPSLDYEIENAGSNMSTGQRQQVCLARAILRNNKILILDEATANMDARTDKLIQKTIRKHFETCTVITVAHRLDTIIDSDKVMFLSSGRLLEFDHPYNLLQNKNGYFYKLASECGFDVVREFLEISFKTFHNR